MYGTFTNICPKNHPNVGKYTIHGAYGIYIYYVRPQISLLHLRNHSQNPVGENHIL